MKEVAELPTILPVDPPGFCGLGVYAGACENESAVTLNQRVAGSSPARLILNQHFTAAVRAAFLLSTLSSTAI